MRGGGVFRRGPNGEIETLIADRKFVGGIALNAGGGILVTGLSLAHWDEQSGALRDIFAEWQGKPLFGLNDLTMDDQGSIWVGSFGCDIHTFDFKSTPPPGSLFRIDPPGQVTHLWEGVEVTNGLGFSPTASCSTTVIPPPRPSGPMRCGPTARSATGNCSRSSPRACPMA